MMRPLAIIVLALAVVTACSNGGGSPSRWTAAQRAEFRVDPPSIFGFSPPTADVDCMLRIAQQRFPSYRDYQLNSAGGAETHPWARFVAQAEVDCEKP
jgi:hypothetical protein